MIKLTDKGLIKYCNLVLDNVIISYTPYGTMFLCGLCSKEIAIPPNETHRLRYYINSTWNHKCFVALITKDMIAGNNVNTNSVESDLKNRDSTLPEMGSVKKGVDEDMDYRQQIDWDRLRASDDNPIKALRKELGMSINSFTVAAGVPRTTLYSTEQGSLTNISDNIHTYFSQRFVNYNKDNIIYLYNSWISVQRKIVKNNNKLPPVAVIRQDMHPFDGYLGANNMTKTGFSSLAKVPKNIIYNYTNKGKQESMPALMRDALKECGMSSEDISALDKAGTVYYRTYLSSQIDERREYDRRRE